MILDAHKWADFFKNTEDMKPVHRWINKSGKIVYSNHQKIESEIKKSTGKKAMRYLEEKRRAGKAKFISKEAVMTAKKDIEKLTRKSNDIHILALARASKTKLLCSKDGGLHVDFTNKNIIIVKGKVYQNKTHKHLLKLDACP